VIEVRGVNTHNKGAHLMMLAVAEAMREHSSLTMSPNGADFTERARAGYAQTFLLNQSPTATRLIGDALPAGVKRAFGLVSDREISGVLDAAGFAYSDSFPATRSQREAGHVKRWRSQEKPVVFLPQAFGPFERSDQRKWSRALLENASIIFARDRISLRHLEDLGVANNARVAPDFTVGLDVGLIPAQFTEPFGAIVPNEKLVTQGKISEEDYVAALVEVARGMRKSGLRPVIVVHEFNDRQIGQKVAERASATFFTHSNPLVLKRVLGDAQFAVASRFHAIVSALALATPVAAFGWSHKYEELMRDFGVPDWLMGDAGTLASATEMLGSTTDAELNSLRSRVNDVKASNAQMWADVRAMMAPSRVTCDQ